MEETKGKKQLYDFFRYMENEDNKSMLGGMAWDEICWHIHFAERAGISAKQLATDFPSLLGHIVERV